MDSSLITVKVQKLRPEAILPAYATDLAAGSDMCACLEREVTLEPGSFAKIPTGLSIQLPQGYEAQVRPRSGLAAKYGITVLNSPGTIDADYRGEVAVLLINLGKEKVVIHQGDRIAQMVIARCEQASFVTSVQLDATQRGNGGFGSTGV
ncbi:dUTP diphosphatase [Sphaerochaeta sp.]|uniref:dUTP diphosphatase n=1 Tax=Sphaerochaeta sp. TaxID=1972642 RepID=UPI002FC8BA44